MGGSDTEFCKGSVGSEVEGVAFKIVDGDAPFGFGVRQPSRVFELKLVGSGEVKFGTKGKLGTFAVRVEKISPKGKRVVLKTTGKILDGKEGRV